MRRRNTMEDFQRDITHRIWVEEDGGIRLTGIIRDRYHDIRLEVLVDGEALVIRECKVVFEKAPSPYCGRVAPRLELLVGTRVGPGLSRKLTEALGGRSGCGNLRTLLSGLLPLALNVRACAGIEDEQEMLGAIHHHLQGTCAGYPRSEEGEAQ